MGASDAATNHRPEPSELTRRFAEFGESNRDYSPLYWHLATRAAANPDLIALLADARPGQRRPVLVFAAVHYLLLGGVDHPLRRYYPSLGGDLSGPSDPGGLWAAFHDLCLTYRDELLEIVSTRNTQTNEVGRCVGLYPALRLAARLAGGPLALVEIGSSAGLNLRVNRYRYRYSTGVTVGDPDSPLRIDCRLAGPLAPDLDPDAEPAPDGGSGRRVDPDAAGGLPLATRVGVDLAPVDVADPDATRWLAACVYADQPERVARLRAAVEIARRDPVPQVAGNALDVLPEVFAGLPAGATPCLLHTWAVTYFPRPDRARFVAMLGELAARRRLLWIAGEPGGTLPGLGRRSADPDSGSSLLALADLDRPDALVHPSGPSGPSGAPGVPGSGPRPRWRMLGRMQAHGAWLRWSDPDSGRPLPGSDR